MPRVDLHSHSRFSPDSRMQFADIADACQRQGIDVLATTDHETAEGALRFADWVDRNDRDLHVIPGEELMTHEGELIGLYLEETIECPIGLEEAVDEIRAQGGLVLLQHPFDPLRSGLEEESWEIDPDIVEVFNARTRTDGANEKARAYANERNIPACACSDAHTLGEFGSAYTQTPDFEPADPDELVEAIDAGTLHADQSPLWVSAFSTMARVLDIVGL